jgi:hypothetical protein
MLPNRWHSHVSCLVPLRCTISRRPCERHMPIPSRETPIERIYRKAMGHKMPLSIKVVLLRKSSAEKTPSSRMKSKKMVPTSFPNLVDYPGTMSQWEKESLSAEARLSSGKGKTKRVPPRGKKQTT